MPQLSFQVEGVEAVRFAASPTLALKLRVTNATPVEQIHSALLRCQVQIEASRRRYTEPERGKLFDLFGRTEQWGRSLHNFLWTQTQVSVPGFKETTQVDLLLPCTCELHEAVGRYLHALDDGEAPLCLLFSGTVFYAGDRAPLQIDQVGWDQQATFRLPVKAWRDAIAMHFPDSRWLRLESGVVDRLLEYKNRLGYATWEQTLESLLATIEEEATP